MWVEIILLCEKKESVARYTVKLAEVWTKIGCLSLTEYFCPENAATDQSESSILQSNIQLFRPHN